MNDLPPVREDFKWKVCPVLFMVATPYRLQHLTKPNLEGGTVKILQYQIDHILGLAKKTQLQA